MKEAYQKAIKDYLHREDVTGVMIGLKFKDGKWTDEECISIRVKKKKPINELDSKEIIPKTINGKKTDVLEVNYKKLILDNCIRQDSVSPGLSIGPENTLFTGSVGCVVFKNGVPSYLHKCSCRYGWCWKR